MAPTGCSSWWPTVALDLEAIRHVYALMPLTEYVVTSLNPQRRLTDLAEGIAEIGYPRS
jgi:hypothetical protein